MSKKSESKVMSKDSRKRLQKDIIDICNKMIKELDKCIMNLSS